MQVYSEGGLRLKKKARNTKLDDLLLYLSYFGRYICTIFIQLFALTGRKLIQLFRYIWDKTNSLRKTLFIKLKYLLIILVSPFLKIIHALQRAGKDISEDMRKYGFGSAVLKSVNHFGKFMFGKSGVAVTIFNVVAPIVCVIFCFNVVSFAVGLDYGVKLTVNGKLVGYIENEQVFYDADEILKDRINYLGSDENIKITPEFSIELLESNNHLLTKYQVADEILRYSDVTVEYAYGFYLNGTFMGAVSDNTEVKNTLDGILNKYQTQHPDAEISFKDNLEYSTGGLYLTGSIIDSNWLISQLTSVKSKAGYYIVEDDDSHSLLCDKLGLTMAQLELLNPGFEAMELHTGDKIKTRDEIPFLSVNVTVTENYDVEVPYQTEYYDEGSLYYGVSRVTTEGENGINNLTAKVTYVNNIETDRDVISSRKVSSPVTERIAQGTKPTPEMYSPEEAGYGKYIWPTDGGYVSEYTHWDGGYAGHLGIDIVSYYGAPIYAGASGTVVKATEDYWGYGKYVIIDHGNGFQTLYAHCSAIYVTVGQEVTQGEFIAALGSTGMVTGPHIHFEVRQGNTKLNPVNYLEKIY